jgi:hypothetical protein
MRSRVSCESAAKAERACFSFMYASTSQE